MSAITTWGQVGCLRATLQSCEHTSEGLPVLVKPPAQVGQQVPQHLPVAVVQQPAVPLGVIPTLTLRYGERIKWKFVRTLQAIAANCFPSLGPIRMADLTLTPVQMSQVVTSMGLPAMIVCCLPPT